MFRLTEAENNLMVIIWGHEPLRSGELTALCQEKLGWKRTTTYTVLKNCINKGVAENENMIVRSLIGKDEYYSEMGSEMMDNLFNGSMAGMVSAFIGGRKITKQEYEELKKLIEDAYR